jgi:hypothetical protein
MNKKYYICGLRPVVVEVHKEYRNYLAMNWETGIFEQDFRYSHQINFDPSGDVNEISETEFKKYVNQYKKEKGLL